ncbi:MAG: VOC family protein [Myxococcales bacterium]
MARVTGIGGVFLKAKQDSKALAEWYRKHLGMHFEEFGGAILRWPEDRAEDGGLTVWHVAAPGDDWFPGPLMVNYRVDNLDGMLAQLRAGGVEVVQGPESHENGRFAWVVDPEGNRVELWEPKAG